MTDDVAAQLADLRAELQQLRKQVDSPATAGPARSGTAAQAAAIRPPVWETIGPGQAAVEWMALCSWTDELIARYGLEETIPPCWYRHPPIVEELGALRAAWHGAYTARAVKATDAATWHTTLANTLTRIRGWDRTGCAAAGGHRDQPALPVDPDAEQKRRSFLAEQLDHRPDAPRPRRAAAPSEPPRSH